ncbi:MAG: iron(III) transport system permease protein, partial [Haloarculaceae archaeon]
MDTPDELEQFRDGVARRRLRESLPSFLPVVSGLLALLLLTPVAWVFLRASEVDTGRTISLVLSADTAQIALNSLVLVGVVTAGSILVGVPLAILTVQTDLPFRRFWTITAALPLVIPSYIGAFTFVSAFGPRGALQNVLAPLGIERIPAVYGLPGAALVLVLFTYPYVYLTTRASL